MWRLGSAMQAARRDNGFALRVSVFYGALCFVYGAVLPYLPVWLDFKGLTAPEIGIIGSAPLLIRLVATPGVGLLADRIANHRLVIAVLAAIAAASVAVVGQSSGFWPILMGVVVFQVAAQSIMPLIETIAMTGVKSRGHDYGRMRLWGSATFIVASFIGASLIDRHGAGIIVWMILLGVLATFAAATALPAASAPIAAVDRRRSDWASVLQLARARTTILFLISAGAVQSAHAVFYGFGVLHWREAGISGGWIGTLWAIGVITEIALFWWSARVLAHVTPAGLLVAGAAAAVLRWTVMGFDPPLLLLLPLQVLHGLTYGASHLGAMHVIQRMMPEGQAGTAQALYSTMTAGIGMGAAMLLAGFTYSRFAGASYFAMAALALLGLAAAIALRRCEKPSPP